MAVRIVLKRSSIPNKRPNSDILEPGELALNTNALTPGLFFEAENNEIIKVGPTAVGVEPPTLTPSLGELNFDTITRELTIGGLDPFTAQKAWLQIASPYLGGTNGYVVFVAPEFPTSSDSIDNNGQAAPFRTLNRAVIEVAKNSIVSNNESDEYKNNRYVIYVAPGICPVYNGPGLPLPVDTNPDNVPEFGVNFEATTPSTPDVLTLQEFNPETGGLPLPRGTSILGMDLRKVELRPSYVPTYKNPTTGQGVNQPTTAIVKWTGNSLVEQLSFRDKRSLVRIQDIRTGPAGEGLFVSSRAHCFGLNDQIFFEYAPGTDQRPVNGASAGILSGFYYTYPVDADTFYLSYTPVSASESNFVERVQLPVTPQGLPYLATCLWEGRSHNRLRCLYPASLAELNEFYTKVQAAYPNTFLGKTNQAEVVNPGETQIVGPAPNSALDSNLANTTDNASPYLHNVTVRSNYGLCGVEQDGSVVSGFRSALAGTFTTASLQNDPAAYEIYTTVQDPVTGENITRWYTLQYATWASLPPASRPVNPGLVSRSQQMALLNATEVTNIRYYFTTLTSEDGESFGLPDFENDFRHFTCRSINSAFIQVDTSYSIGCAVGYWSTNGGRMTVTNSSTNFGLNALRAEGFSGIGGNSSANGADPADSNFIFEGIRTPDRLVPRDTIGFKSVELGCSVLSVFNDNLTGVQEISVGPGFFPINIAPYALAPNTAVYVAARGNTVYRAFFVDDGLPTVVYTAAGCGGSATLRVRAIDSTFPTGAAETNPEILNWTSPFIRRWLDPRTLGEASYSLLLTNTSPSHRAPVTQSVLRLNQNSASASLLLRPGVQLDPGPNGGWGRVFSVAASTTQESGDSPQFNEVLLNRNISNNYYVSLALTDGSRPWLSGLDHAHGSYVTYEDRNWYAAANDQWTGVYYNSSLVPTGEVKLPPTSQESMWATSFSSELQEKVSNTYQGSYAADNLADLYPDGTYLRGDTLSLDNYPFELYLDIDNATPNFGLLRHTSPTAIVKILTEDLDPTDTVISVDDVTDIPSPFKSFVVMALQAPSRVEYVQVVGVDSTTNELTVIRGVYGTETKAVWVADSPLTLQQESQEVLPEDYDFDWSMTKSAMIRFLQVMGYSLADITALLQPRYRSSRNVYLSDIAYKPGKNAGYATATGAWPLEFVSPSQLDVLSHSFHSVGRLNYSRGLPSYLRNEIPTKQYYDYLATQLWGGIVLATGGDENGNLPTNGEFTQIETGRPVDTYTSDIKDTTRVDPGPGEGGGGGGADGVTAIYTGTGLAGGPIFAEGTISLLPPTGSSIGGVKQGANITIAPDGTISSQASGTGTVESITFNNGLTGGTITQSGTVGINTGVGLTIGGSNTLDLIPGTVSTIGGVKEGTGTKISPEGSISILPPSGAVIGGVKAGTGVTIATDGTLSVSSVPPAPTSIVLLDSISGQFNGTNAQFSLTSGGRAYTPSDSQSVLVSVGNILQATPLAYSISGSTITFTSPPPAGCDFYAIGLNGVLSGSPAAGITVSLLGDISIGFNGAETKFNLTVGGSPYTPANAYSLYISLGGVIQITPLSYTVAGSIITFTTPPPVGATFYGIAFG